MATLRVHRMRADAVVPRYKTSGAAGMDLAACLATPLTIPPGGVARVPTGLQIALPTGHEGQVRLESGDRIAQLIVTPVTQAEIEVVEDEAALGDTERGDGGFGSTGR
ncbi:MAG: hypothetical protein JRG70_00325 [Deltaproteobacteria bacterium]|nr:hypothetical protein [Deltaproteobacteria bacterium]